MPTIAHTVVLLNIISLLLMLYDKRQARFAKWRVAEKTLLFLAALGGSVGIWLGMKSFRHKTKHKLFSQGIPLLIMLQAALLLYLFMPNW